MSLIDAERDDDALLAAEDEAIRAAARPPEPEPSADDIASLIERLTNGDPQALQPG